MTNYEKRLQRVEERIKKISGKTEFETKSGETVKITKDEVRRIYEAAANQVWNDTELDTNDPLIANVLNAREGNNIGHYLKCLIAGDSGE